MSSIPTSGELGQTRLDPAEVCTLPPRELQARLAWIRREILPHAVSSERIEAGRAIELTAADGLVWKLERLIEAERECCSGIAFEQVASQAPDRVRLEIRGVDPDAAFFDGLQAEGSPARPRSPGSRFARAAGLGVLGSVFVCCVLPIGAGAVLGSSAAALSSLDAPLPIGIGALLGGGAAWWWLGRRGKRTSEPAPSGGCSSDC